MSPAAWACVAFVAGTGIGAFIGWKMRGGDASLVDMQLAETADIRADRLEALARTLGATDVDVRHIEMGVMPSDVATAIRMRSGS